MKLALSNLSTKTKVVYILCAILFFGITIPGAGKLSIVVGFAKKNDLPAILVPYSFFDASIAHFLGLFYFSSEHYDTDRAEKYYRRAISLSPDDALAHYQLGRIAFIRGRFAEAHQFNDRALEIDPENFRSYYMRGLIAGYEHNYKAAAEAFYTFIQYDSIGWAGYNDLSWIYFQDGNFAAAQEVAEIGLGYSPRNPWLLNSVGVALLAQGRSNEAQPYFAQAFNRLLEMKPEDWGIAYPGNDPSIYAQGLASMRESVQHNLELVEAAQPAR